MSQDYRIAKILRGEKHSGICPICCFETELTIEHNISRSIAYRFLRQLIPKDLEDRSKRIKHLATILHNQGGMKIMCQSCNQKQETWKRNLIKKSLGL